MLELMTLVGLFGGALVALAALCALGFLLKLAFRLVLLPFAVVGLLVKLALLGTVLAVGVLLLPALLALALLALPLLLLLGAGAAVVSLAT